MNTCVCTVCGEIGKPVTKLKGSSTLGYILLLFFVLPGVFYLRWRKRNTYQACPRCFNDSMIAVKDSTTHMQTETLKVSIDVYGPLKERKRKEKELENNVKE